MHHKYHTLGFVLANFNSGEANKVYKIFTRELGLIIASAQSARTSRSKLKSSLTDYSWGSFTFIKTRRGWRVTDAISDQNLYFSIENKSKLFLCARFFSLLQKLLPDEEPNQELHDRFFKDVEFLLSHNFSEDSLKNFECLVILKILSLLGYLGEEGPWRSFIEGKKADLEFVENFSPFRSQAVREINHSFKESQLL